MLSVDAVHVRLTCDEDTAVAKRFVGVVGMVVSGVGVVFDTVTVILPDVVVFPAASRAVAVRVCVPFPAVVVVHDIEYGDAVSSAPRFAPSSLNWTPDTPILSDAVADTAIIPETVAPDVGAVRETVGNVVSEGGGAVVPEERR
jgi:hypothetical protein